MDRLANQIHWKVDICITFQSGGFWSPNFSLFDNYFINQDVFRVTFSTENEGQLTTGGLGHVKFWKMAATFTGLKLQGELGKFGRTPISDIEGWI